MEIEQHFKDYVRLNVESFPYDEVYRKILEDFVYCRQQLKAIVLNCLYHLDLNMAESQHTGMYQAKLAGYIGLLSKEKNKDKITTEHLLHIVYLCNNVKLNRLSTSPTAPAGMYM